MTTLVTRSLLELARKSALIRRTSAFVVAHTTGAIDSTRNTYGFLRQTFVNNSRASRFTTPVRADIVRRFECIDREVPIGTTPTDGLFLAEMLLNVDAEGSMVECGCYSGGSSAKLSIISKLLGRRLIIFDSFEGLPAVDEYYLRDEHCRRNRHWVTDWTKGRYSSRLDQVQSNIEQYGELSVCTLVKGWFNDTLTNANLPQQVAFAFTDVDLAPSARECIVAIWPRVSERGIYVTHDTAYIKVLQELYKPELWNDCFKSTPPILFGAGYGLCDDSPHLGYMVKGASLSSEYLKNLTIDKDDMNG